MSENQRVGEYLKASVAGETYHTYVPKPLPPNPPLMLAAIYPVLDRANIALGRLDGIGHILPDHNLFLYLYIRKEAVLSSQIEGTQSTLDDLLLYENEETPSVPITDVTEVSCYVNALEYGLKRMRDDHFPLSLRLIKEIHAVLLNHGRGSQKAPGEFRRSQNWIGGSRPSNAQFVPPPPEQLLDILGDLEKFFHDETHQLPTLIKTALIHLQFETIHPFLDGNGRLGRLLITLLLCADGLLAQPLLYLSLYFKTYRKDYYNHLQSVRETGNWEAWILFFLEGVIVTAEQATATAQAILALFDTDTKKIKTLGRATPSALMIYQELQKIPVADIQKLCKITELSVPTVTKNLMHLIDIGIIKEKTGKTRHRVFVYQKYIDILNRGIGEFV